MKAAYLLILCFILAGACSTAPTPVAPISSLTAVLNTPETQQPLTYRLFVQPEWIEPEDLQQLEESGVVVFSSLAELDKALPDNSIEATYGLIDTWQQSSRGLQAVILLHPDLSPLSPGFSDFIAESLPNLLFDTENGAGPGNLMPEAGTGLSVEQSRTMLANMGYPDGVPLRLITGPVPAQNTIVDLLMSRGFDLTIQERDSSQEVLDAFLRGEGQLALINATTVALDEIHRIELFSLNISYRSSTSEAIAFTSGGWPFIPMSDN